MTQGAIRCAPAPSRFGLHVSPPLGGMSFRIWRGVEFFTTSLRAATEHIRNFYVVFFNLVARFSSQEQSWTFYLWD